MGRLRGLPTAADDQLAAAGYARRPGDVEYHPYAGSVLDVQDGRVQEIVAFHDPALFPAFGLPATLPAR